MGGRGSRFGYSITKNHTKISYGTEFKSVLHVENIKFLKPADPDRSTTLPLKTQTRGRIYVSLTDKSEPKSIALYKDGKRYEQIDLDHAHKIDGHWLKPHVHLGYYHVENGGSRPVNARERKLIDKVNKIWENSRRK